MTKLLYSIGTGLQLQVDVRISDFVAWRTVSHDQKGCIIVGRIQEVMTIASACRECDAGAWPDRLAARIGDGNSVTEDQWLQKRLELSNIRANSGRPALRR